MSSDCAESFEFVEGEFWKSTGCTLPFSSSTIASWHEDLCRRVEFLKFAI
jgi:hypothetical protein